MHQSNTQLMFLENVNICIATIALALYVALHNAPDYALEVQTQYNFVVVEKTHVGAHPHVLTPFLQCGRDFYY